MGLLGDYDILDLLPGRVPEGVLFACLSFGDSVSCYCMLYYVYSPYLLIFILFDLLYSALLSVVVDGDETGTCIWMG